MKRFLKLFSRKWLVLPPIAVGLVAVLLARLSRTEPEPVAPAETVRTLRIVRVPVVDVVPRVIGYGTAEPRRIWQAVAEVRGRIVQTHPDLKPGATVKQGAILLRIDPKEYELAIAQLEADIEQVTAQLDELAVQETNDQDLLKLESASLTLAEAELARLESLRDKNSVSASQVDAQRRAVLAQRRSVQSLKNKIRLVSPRRKSLQAALAVKQAALAQAKLDLAKTVIRAPFHCRVGEVQLEVGQYVVAGQVLFRAHGTDAAEIEAQIPLDQLRHLIDPAHRIAAPVMLDTATVKRLFNFDVTVRYRIGDFEAEWTGRVVRMREQIEPQTHTVGLVVAVDKPYAQAIPGKRPPLVQGMFCEVELRGAVRRQRVVIPRLAVHDGHVYVLDSESRLRRKEVQIAFGQSDFLCLRAGLQGGERLVVSDPAPAIEGMRVQPIEDQALAELLVAQAQGAGTVK
ncbi:MAG: HlyD family efflux transporter periplasmic adaptor subunit [Planctomycetes bacterium]|nr:HlyD family efflux transporter periplasmic adaptor subunit [Planctomycetota bacterium]